MRLKALPFEKAIKMRISGDEFGVFIFGLADSAHLRMEEIWQELCSCVLYGPIDTANGALPISISAGMAVYCKDTRDVYAMIEYADFAMYMAKKNGKSGYCTFDKAQYEIAKGRQGNIGEL